MRRELACLILLGCTGCMLELLTTTAVQSDLQSKNAAAAARALDYAKSSTNQLSIQQAIDAYRAEKGNNPPSLQALVPEYLPSVPVGPDGNPLGYDPATGRLTGGPAPAAAVLPSGDTQKLQQISAAVQRYGRETGRYPITLWTLVPNYLPDYPKTASGQDFFYDPQTGTVSLPQAYGAQPMAQPAPGGGRTAPVGGGGPMVGEAMTGIAISNQLDNMSNAGATAAQGRAGSSLDQSQGIHNAQQEQALNDLGM